MTGATDKRSARRRAAASIYISIALCLAYATAFFTVYAIPLGIFCYFAGQFIGTLLHELGHAAAARACGWRVVAIIAWPFGVQLDHRQLVPIARRHRNGLRGYVACLPAGLEVATLKRYAIILMAGPLSSLSIGVIALISAGTWLTALDNDAMRPSIIGVAFALQTFDTFLWTAVPNGRTNDGAQLLKIWRSDMTLGLRPLGWLRTLLDHRTRLRDLPPWLIEAARRVPLPTDQLTAHLAGLEIGMVLDTLPVDAPRARALIDDFRSRYEASEWLDSCDAYFAAVWEANAAGARATLWPGERTEDMRPMVMAAEAAVAAREGDVATARSRLAEMRRAVKRKSPFHDATFADIGRKIEEILA
ncbi:MAG TPA: site-2 protease family protein [Sphingomonas sp.]|nr:site-2 protease family protein [Sphingomonas sp.]